MLRFISLCMAFIAVSFFAVPIYFGVAEEHQKLTQITSIEPTAGTLTFEEIYALSDETIMSNPYALNAIEPASGEEQIIENFSIGFSNKEDSALAEIQIDAAESKLIEEF